MTAIIATSNLTTIAIIAKEEKKTLLRLSAIFSKLSTLYTSWKEIAENVQALLLELLLI